MWSIWDEVNCIGLSAVPMSQQTTNLESDLGKLHAYRTSSYKLTGSASM